MKRKITYILSVLILLVIAGTFLCYVTGFLELKSSKYNYSSFYEEEQNIDVLLLGSSHVKYGFFVEELWGEQGISAYNLAGDGSTIPVSYWVLVNALEYQEPKMVVMDVFDMWPGRKYSESWGHVHTQMDAIPFGSQKYRMVMDVFDDAMLQNDGYSKNKKWELLWNFGEYHSRWNSITEDFFTDYYSIVNASRIWKGSQPLIGLVKRDKTEYLQDDVESLAYDYIAKEYIEKMIRLCDANGIELLLINTGYDCSPQSKLFHDSVSKIAMDNNIKYIDFTHLDVINFDTDLYDSGHNTHVNYSGAMKLTYYLEKYISLNYKLPDHRNDERYAEWNEDYKKYVTSKQHYLTWQESFADYFMLLYDNDYSVIVDIRDSSALEDYILRKMLINLGVKVEGDANLFSCDVTSKAEAFINDYSNDLVWRTSTGICRYVNSDDGYSILMNDVEVFSALLKNEFRVNVIVLDKNTGELINSKSF